MILKELSSEVLDKSKKFSNRIIPKLPSLVYFFVLSVISIFRLLNLMNIGEKASDIITTATFFYALICLSKRFCRLIEKIANQFFGYVNLMYFVVLILICVITAGVFRSFGLSLPENVEDGLCIFSFALLILEVSRNNENTTETPPKKSKALRTFAIITLALFLVVGVPIIINECYKLNCGYSTVWDGADVLGFYGNILGAVIAVITLASTIIFTKKQIQRDSYLQAEKQKLSKLESIFLEILDSINPILTLKNVMDNGFTDPSKAINVLQKYQLDCKTACDRLNAHLNMSDYPKFKAIIESIATVSNTFFSISEEEIEQYSNLRLWIQRGVALKMIQNEKRQPGSFSIEDLENSNEILEKTQNIKYSNIEETIKKLNNDYIETYETKFRELLQLNGATFDRLNSEAQQCADSILYLRRKQQD